MHVRRLLCLSACLGSAVLSFTQDPVKVDPKHYKIETENAEVRVLRIHYGPHEKSVMHSHPASVVVYLSDGTIRMTTPDGKTADEQAKMGQAMYEPASVHNPENAGDSPFEAVLVELKSPKTARARSGKK